MKRRIASITAGLALLAPVFAPAPASADATPSPIRHIWVIDLENSSWSTNFGNSFAGNPFKAQVMPALGTVIQNYYGIGHNSLDNYIAQVSGQAPNPDTQGDCLSGSELTPGTEDAPMGQAIGEGCFYPPRVKTIADQLEAQGLTWKGYEEDMGDDLSQDGRSRCSTFNSSPRSAGDAYVAKHDPFAWFHSVLDDLGSCESQVVPLTELAPDLQRIATTPNFSFITPNLNDDDHDVPAGGGSAGFRYSDGWLAYYLPQIMASPAYRQGGMIVITYDEAASGLGFVNTAESGATCCGEIPGPNSPSPGIGSPGGGQVGAEVISPYVKPGVLTTANSYNHYSALRSYEDLLGITTGGADDKGHLGYAAGNGIADSTPEYTFRSFGCDDVFTLICPPMAAQVGAPTPTGTGTDVGPRPADGTAHWLNPGPQGNDLHGVSCSTDVHCVAVGATGSVVSSADGMAWSARNSGTSADLNAVSCVARAENCVAVGAAGTVRRTSDGGQSWAAAPSGTQRDLSGVSCPTASACYAVGAGGTIIASGDGGATWSAQDSHTTRDLDQIACPAADTCYVSGAFWAHTSTYQDSGLLPTTTNQPAMLSTSDGGATWVDTAWVAKAASSGPRLRGIGCVDAGRCTAGDEQGGFAYTTNGGSGNTWSAASSSADSNQHGRVRGISCLASGHCVAVADSGFTYGSTDGGNHWFVATARDDFLDLYGVSCPSSAACYAVGRNGAIMMSGDEGATWTAASVNQAASNLMRSVQGFFAPPAQTVGAVDLAGTSCPSASSCVSVGKQGAVLISGDGGGSWRARRGVLEQPPKTETPAGSGGAPTPAPIPASADAVGADAVGLNAVSCPSSASCVAVGDQGKVATTSDLGNEGGNWTPQTSGTASGLHSISCPTGGGTCFAVGDYGTIVKSTDGGSTWKSLDSGTLTFLNGVSCTDASDCVAVGSQGTILATSDGSTWQARTSPTAAYLSGVSCTSASSCLAVGSAGTVVGSGDGGLTWSLRTAPSDDDLYAISCSARTDCVATGSAGTVASTADGGRSWSLQGTGTTDSLRSVSCPGPAVCFAAGDNGAVMAIVPHPPIGGGNAGGGGGGSPGGSPQADANTTTSAGQGEVAGVRSSGGSADIVDTRVTFPCKVPRLTGRHLPSAVRLLRRTTCRMGKVRRLRSRKRAGTVIRQSPRAGTTRPGGARVVLVVSRGR